jgi:D-alanyl-D-alanine carboxypeptidase/D-alanyl-D-alanine-endopeptidase (penicillin-binding protein 4)
LDRETKSFKEVCWDQMKRYSACFALFLLALAPSSVSEATPSLETPLVRRVSETFQPAALAEFKRALAAEGRDLNQHGLYVEALDASSPAVAFNEDLPFNPASVIKLATSLAALDALGPDHRFRTEFFADGTFDKRTGILDGDLVLRSGADPSFSIPDARNVGDALRRLGLRRVTGNLVVAGPFNCNYNTQTDVSTGVFRRQSRLAIAGATRFEELSDPRGWLLLTVESEPLIKILHYQNAHSVNAMAELLATHLGGGAGVQRFLSERLHLSDVYISRASGLDVNRLTARGTVELLRALVNWLAERKIAPEEVLPIAAIDASTLSDRFTEDRFAGSVVAKTGTLHDTDGGVAALAGLAYTAHGPLLFAIYDMAEGRRVEHLRQTQDLLIKNLMDEFGGPAPRITDPARRELPPPAGQLIPAPAMSQTAN